MQPGDRNFVRALRMRAVPEKATLQADPAQRLRHAVLNSLADCEALTYSR